MDDMDMDIPLPEELEFLESNSHFAEQEQEEEDHHYYFPDLDPAAEFLESNSQQSPSPQDLAVPSAEPEFNGHKRSRPPSPEEKRAKVRVAVEEDFAVADEDWPRYSPPPAPPEQAMEEMMFEKEKTLSRFASEIDGECMPITAPSGNRVYAKLNRFQGEERVTKLDYNGYSAELSSEPVNVILERLEQEAFAKALEASSEGQSVLDIPEAQTVHERLWVDKYAPKSFTELLSDEQTNREVLLWLKQWDSIVFGSEIRSTSDDVLSSLKRHSSIVHNQKPLNSKFPRMNGGPKWSNGRRYINARSMDESGSSKSIQDVWNAKSRNIGPPEQKILLLCGSPGLGKTTLAHVAARHCGYHVVEVNASDDRSTASIEAKILDVVQMNSVLSDSRPKCLVVDEIDGALGDGKGAVEVLLKMISSERKPDAGKQSFGKGQQERKSSKKGSKAASLSRPVICICNDLYAPALRPLRQVAKVHIFVQPTVSRVVNRLTYICNKEGMKASAIALTALAEYTECDIRSCLNTLQFLSKKNEALNVFDIGSQVVGQKDTSKNVLDVWKEIFHKRRTKKTERKSHRGKSFEFDSLYSLVSNRGDSNLILDGIHENVLQLNYHDPVMQKTVKCFDNLGVYDLMHQYIMHTQQMPLYVYLPLVAITVHHIVSQVQKPNIEWPKSHQRYRTMMMEKMDILNTWHHKIPPYIARNLSASSFVEDLISPLLHILSPPTVRPVAFQLLSDKEQNDLAQLVSTMVSYTITYKTLKSDILPQTQRCEVADGLALSLVPPISDFINFKDYTSNHYVLSVAMKQVLVHEVEKHKILQVGNDKAGAFTNGGHEVIETGTNNIPLANTSHATAVDLKINENQANVLSWQLNANPTTVSPNLDSNKISRAADCGKLLNMGNMKKPSRSSSSFFDRFKKVNAKGLQSNDRSPQEEATLEKDRYPLLFKFNEGFTNAVKRPVRIREFLS
ncbi:chromosome transmission fidelity protein 18 homolog isoform X1 [Glycine soja]|uniref:Chromosome transmission fidelity protein 18 homolog n=1 Tax=Glycine soja TaxID=3848 RepID=A0A445F233_GLYSO|nr:chromosome transmission fidelity protein 18 homolog isoform X1 [Glycine soja]RZB42836.1 Chromosome transmission fidelity protein 18-like [Glycine soja]